MQVKIFTFDQEKELNKFIENNAILSNGVTVKDGHVVILSKPRDEVGLKTEHLVDYVDQQVSETQQGLITITFELRKRLEMQRLKRGTLDEKRAQSAEILDHKRAVETKTRDLVVLRQILREIKNGKLVF